MEVPGMSLFQGAGSIHINNSAQDRLEEQEELEDQKRRNEELKHKLANAFDDLQDDDEASSVNSSGNHTLETPQMNGGQLIARTGSPPTYVESLNHLKESKHGCDSPKYCDTPKNHMQHLRAQEEISKLPYSPFGAGDGQNHYYHQEFRVPGHLNGINNRDARQEFMNYEELTVMYEMRVKECQNFANINEKLEHEIEGLRGRLSAAIHDKDKAELSLQEAHHLLASSKHKSMELEQKITLLTEKIMMSEQDKEQLQLELKAANISLQEVQQRFHTMQVSSIQAMPSEETLNISIKVAHTHNNDVLFREQQDRHREEVDRLQTDLMKAKNRLDEKENEIKVLEKRCKEREKEKEELIIEKGATINRLAGELEAAQRWDGRADKRARDASREQVKQLGLKLEMTARELKDCRDKLEMTKREFDKWHNSLNQILQESLTDNAVNIGGSPRSPEKLSSLKEVLNRYKQQIQKLPILQEEISKRDKRLDLHRKQESELRAKIEEYKGMEMQLNSRLAVLQNKLDLLADSGDRELLETCRQQNEQLRRDVDDARAELRNAELKYAELEMEFEKLKCEKGSRASIAQEANADLLRELERCAGQLHDTRRDNAELKTLYLQVCSARDSVNRELKDMHTRSQREKEMYRTQEKDLVERIEKEKQQVEKLTTELTTTKEELERANKRISELQKEFTDKQKEFTEKLNKFLEDEKTAMRKDMAPCLQCEKQLKHIQHLEEQISKYSIKFATQESNETLMKELKGKAEFFQQYIVERFRKLAEQRTVGTNTEADSEDAGHECAGALAAKTSLMMKEKAIRDQIAEKFTLEIKTIEMNCARRLKEMETEQLTAVTKLKDLLERKAKEVDTLKEFIMSERAKVTQILESKENEISVLIKEHNDLQADCQKARDDSIQWQTKAEKYRERLSRLGSLEDNLKKEKEDWKQMTSSCAKECQTLKTKVVELHSTISKLEQQHMKLKNEHQTLQEKYKNTKRTVLTYKDYMAKKDTHINSEMNRIQDEYRKIFVKLQNQINYYVNCREQDERNRGKAADPFPFPQSDYTEKLNELTQDFARLAQSNFTQTPESSK